MFIETHLKQCKVSDVGSGTGYQMETGVTGEEELSEPGSDWRGRTLRTRG